MNRLLLSLAALMAMSAPLAAQAAPCRDAGGHFVSCTARHRAEARRDHRPMTRVAPKRCRIGNRFASCSAPGAHPA